MCAWAIADIWLHDVTVGSVTDSLSATSDLEDVSGKGSLFGDSDAIWFMVSPK